MSILYSLPQHLLAPEQPCVRVTLPERIVRAIAAMLNSKSLKRFSMFVSF